MPAKAGIWSIQEKAVEMRGGWLYLMSNKPDGVLYTGVTAYLAARGQQHRSGPGSTFCRRYGPNTLVFVERFEAIAREKQVKAWKRA